jgi:hypothetical protein
LGGTMQGVKGEDSEKVAHLGAGRAKNSIKRFVGPRSLGS